MSTSEIAKKRNWPVRLFLAFTLPFALSAALLSTCMLPEYAEIITQAAIPGCLGLSICLLFMSAISVRWLFPGFLSGMVGVGGSLAFIVIADCVDIHQQSYNPELGNLCSGFFNSVAMVGIPAGLITLLLVWIIRWSIKNGWWRAGGSAQ